MMNCSLMLREGASTTINLTIQFTGAGWIVSNSCCLFSHRNKSRRHITPDIKTHTQTFITSRSRIRDWIWFYLTLAYFYFEDKQ